ncbi:zinc ribbon domain-containing protein [Marinisporobacter balticus]|uniref:Putative nucleic acid-binding Zn-ribbon protein n=1 Tax=Marinisporobacter balticus TaxID=2018667 RepID=A0A4R2L453_9FIRM|nr:C4-type zinc ribbon domain-containing protein [Marinisporobacter balticus]TCO80017.1 putative nucleic acid-binding Zn-ribbon protein [Marinisporobacter balticus]
MQQMDYLWKLQKMENIIQEEKRMLKSITKGEEIGEKIKQHKEFKNIYEVRKKKNEEKKKELTKFEDTYNEMSYKKDEIKNKLYDGKIIDLKQLDSLLKEQEKLEDTISSIDSKMLEIMEVVEAIDEELKATEIQERRMGSIIKKMLLDRKIQIHNIEEKITEQMKEKEEVLKNINEKYMEIYMDIKRKKNNPIARIESDICTGCHMDLPIMVLSKLKSQEIVICSNCGRIVYSISEG